MIRAMFSTVGVFWPFSHDDIVTRETRSKAASLSCVSLLLIRACLILSPVVIICLYFLSGSLPRRTNRPLRQRFS